MLSHKRIYLFGSVVAGILVLALLVQAGLQYYLKPRIGHLLQKIIVTGSDSLYRFDQGQFSVDVWDGGVSLDSCRLSVDSARYAGLDAAGTLPALTASMRLARVKVSGLDIWKWFHGGNVDIGTLTLVGADVTLYRHPPSAKSGKGESPKSKELYPLIQSTVRSIRIGELLLGDLSIAYDDGDSAKPFRWAFERCDVRLRDILVDSSTLADSTRIAYARGLTVALRQVSMLTGKGLYRVTSGALFYDFAKRTALINAFSLHPILNAADFYQKVRYQQDRYVIDVPKIRLFGLNISELLQFNRLRVDSAELSGARIHITNDRTYPPSGQSKLGKYPQQLLLKAPLDIQVRKLRVEDGSLSYGEKNEATLQMGTLTFGHVHGLLTQVTNDPALIAENPWWKADLYAGFLGSSPLHAVFSFDLRSPSGKFTLEAYLKDLDAGRLNPVTTALAKASVRSFHLEQLSYTVSGDEQSASGSLRMRYSGLQLELLKAGKDPAKPSGGLSGKPLLSFLVNKLAIYPDNPSGKKAERVATGITQKRNPTKSFFNLIWKTLFQGVHSIAIRGIGKSL
jgi:hypothetical protein